MEHDTLDFYRRREEQERALVDRTTEPNVRQVHLDLALRYATLVEANAQHRDTLTIVMR